MTAHDSILAARVKQTRDANRHRRASPFVEHDLVYVSTKNISFPKGFARKFVPKYIGPYAVTRDFNNNTYQLDLPAYLRQRGIHNAFHASLLRAHVPNDDCCSRDVYTTKSMKGAAPLNQNGLLAKSWITMDQKRTQFSRSNGCQEMLPGSHIIKLAISNLSTPTSRLSE